MLCMSTHVYWISKEWAILLCRIWPTLVFLILQKIVFWFWRKSFSDFEENRFMIFSQFFPDFEENRFLIYKKIVSDFFTILFRFWRKSFFDFGENRFLIFSWFLETRFIKLICIRKNTEKIVCKSRDFKTILSTIYSTIFLVWVAKIMLIYVREKKIHPYITFRMHFNVMI